MVKGKKFLSILTAAVILAMLIAAVPANVCFAETGDESIDVSPSSGEIGDDVDVDGTDFEDGEIIYFYFSSDSSYDEGDDIDTLDAYEFLDSDTADSSGDVSISFEVPDELTEGDDADEDVEDGTYYVYAVYEENEEIWARDKFTVNSGVTGDESISVVPTSAEIDEYVEIEGDDFDTGSTVYFYFSKESASVGEEIDSDVQNYELVESDDASSSGSVSGYFYVPDELTDGDEDEDVTSGTYYVYATYEDDDEIVAKDSITIIASELSFSPSKGKVGSRLTLTGSGFGSNKSITIKLGGSSVAIDSGDEKTSSSGAFSSSILVPETAKGSYSIAITVGSNSTTASSKFTVEPGIEIDPEDGGVNDRVIVTGTGFTKNGNISITFDGDDVATGEANSYGSFDATFNVPEVSPGTYKVKADTAEATFTISTEVSISPTTSLNSPGYVGDSLTISGTGFKADHEIEITYASTPVTFTTTSESDGSFSYTFEVPPSTAGEHTITATDGTSSMSVSFVMESTPPATPPPLKPYMDGKAGSKAFFDWEDVVADIDGTSEQSLPITYELQVATDENFTNKLVNKTGLTTSEYTLTEDEALESTNKETPYYYWRVRAVDAASNASPWTGTGIFTVGFIFSFPGLSGWLLYVLIGIGAVALFFIGLWVGRRGGGGDYY